MDIKDEIINTDLLIIGGGTAGCLAAVEAKKLNSKLNVTILEKGHIDRSGCLASGMNALNAYLHPGETPESFTRYVRYDAMGLLREDLVLSGAKEINAIVKEVESWGLPIKKDEKGNYLKRGRWNVTIEGESLKPILAEAVRNTDTKVLNYTVATNYLVDGKKVIGAVGFGLHNGKFYVINAKVTIVATGGASGIYKPNNEGLAHHKMWYSPFNTGTGYAMGIRAGAEMTGLEMRFVALRTKDTICPTGTLALGFAAPQVNARGEQFMKMCWSHLGGEGAPTCIRAYAPVREIQEGRGPCFMDTRHLNKEKLHDLKQAYLDMYPGIVLYWAANNFDPSREPIEICGTEPYIMGGHCQAGYWIDVDRKTTLDSLYAGGDVAGGYPYKFVTGCWAEGVIAARSAVKEIEKVNRVSALGGPIATQIAREKERTFSFLKNTRKNQKNWIAPDDFEDRLQKVMEEYAGGIRAFYELNAERLQFAAQYLAKARKEVSSLVAGDLHELMQVHEVIDRLDVAEVLVQHLLYRQETRWPCFQTRLDFPQRDDEHWLKFVNSVRQPSGEIKMLTRPYEQIVPGDRYSPK